jgi:hypothetical protein
MLDVIAALTLSAVLVTFLITLIGTAPLSPAVHAYAYGIAAGWVVLMIGIAASGGFAPGVIGPVPGPVLAFGVLTIGGLAAWFSWPAFGADRHQRLPHRRGVFSHSLCPGPAVGTVCPVGRLGRHDHRSRRDPARRDDCGRDIPAAAPDRRLERLRDPRSRRRAHARRTLDARNPLSPVHRRPWQRGDGDASVDPDPDDARPIVAARPPDHRLAPPHGVGATPARARDLKECRRKSRSIPPYAC